MMKQPEPPGQIFTQFGKRVAGTIASIFGLIGAFTVLYTGVSMPVWLQFIILVLLSLFIFATAWEEGT
jgi:hypothetical protein